MKTSSGERNPVELLAEEFLDRKRRGEEPTLREYLEDWTRRVAKVAQPSSAGRRGDRGPPHPRGPDRGPEERLRLRSSGYREPAGVNRSTKKRPGAGRQVYTCVNCRRYRAAWQEGI